MVIERIQTWARETGTPPTSSEWNPARGRAMARKALAKAHAWGARTQMFEGGEWPGTYTVRELFGSFSAALADAGFEPRPRGRTPNELTERQVAELRARVAGPAGAAQLKVKIKSVVAAQAAQDKLALRVALFDLAASAMAWCDSLDERGAA